MRRARLDNSRGKHLDFKPQDLEWLRNLFAQTRRMTRRICEPLSAEDMMLQCAEFTSPTKWHLAHTTWFFEEMILKAFSKDYKSKHPMFGELFNSYYLSVGKLHPRPHRNWISRPSITEILMYRDQIDQSIEEAPDSFWLSPETFDRMRLGIEHEKQHQELILMDIKYNLFQNPFDSVYRKDLIKVSAAETTPHAFQSFDGGIAMIGANSDASFAFDNELPAHRRFIEAFQLGSRLITCGEYLEFILDGGYQKPSFWLSDAWTWLQNNQISQPLYWAQNSQKDYRVYELSGWDDLDPSLPVSHLSYYEADAYARWAGARLAREEEWEFACLQTSADSTTEANFLESDLLGASAASPTENQLHGNLWEWTSSDYSPYPGYKAYEGSLGEYNSKFMCNQRVLRGGCYATPKAHYRPSYRNYYYPNERWAASGLRLARDH